jgi:hypothetical protein
MKGELIPVVALKDYHHLFKKGDECFVFAELYDEDTLIRNEIWAVYESDESDIPLRFYSWDNKPKKTERVKKHSPALYAPKGSFKKLLLQLKTGEVYPTNNFRKIEEWFKKQKHEQETKNQKVSQGDA